MKATEIVRRVDDLGRIIIPKEIKRTLKIRKGGPLLTTVTPVYRLIRPVYCVVKLAGRVDVAG